MFLIIIFIISILIFILLVSPLKRIANRYTSKTINKKNIKKNIKKSSKKKEKFTPKIETKHYVKGFIRPEVAYKANTVDADKFGFNIHKVMNESKSKVISGVFNDVTNDNYNLFNNLENLNPLDISKGKLYQNLYYDPKTERKGIFSTKLPDIADLELEDNVTPKQQNSFAFIANTYTHPNLDSMAIIKKGIKKNKN